jgi:glycine/sarcosine N-methyltransferase
MMTYDTFSADYDRFVRWSGRLAIEMPFLEGQLQLLADRKAIMPRVLDAACGTGMHAIALTKIGYLAAGADLSSGMIERARANAAKAGLKIPFEIAGFGELAQAFGIGDYGGRNEWTTPPFDALLCLGNSLPHVLADEDLAAAINDFAACLRPGGLLLIQNRNFEAVMAQGERWMEPQSYREGEVEWLFLRFYDFEADGLLTFNILTLKRESQGEWTQQITTTRMRPLQRADLTKPLADAGFQNVRFYGNMEGELFIPESSSNLVITSIKK